MSKSAFGVKSYALPKSTTRRVCTDDTKGAFGNNELTVPWIYKGYDKVWTTKILVINISKHY